MKWISLKDEMPEIEVFVLVAAKSGIHKAKREEIEDYSKYANNGTSIEWTGEECSCCPIIDDYSGITHWTPLPDKPKDDE